MSKVTGAPLALVLLFLLWLALAATLAGAVIFGAWQVITG